MTKRVAYLCLFWVPFSMTACVEPYNPGVSSVELNYLVVEASLDANGNAAVKLSRTRPLYSGMDNPPVEHAMVRIESTDGTSFLLDRYPGGLYQKTFPIDIGQNFRVNIEISPEEIYYSDYVPVVITPPIDSLYWRPATNEIKIYVDTHDPTNKSRYYKWDVFETFEYRSAYRSVYKFEGDTVYPRASDEFIYQCWETDTISIIHITTTDHLTSDVVSQYQLMSVPTGTRKLGFRYSLNVRQRTLTADAHEYFRLLKQTTESLGGLFDPIPAEVRGNFHDAGPDNRPVIGFFIAGSVDEKRMFVSRDELPEELRFLPRYDCVLDTILNAEIPLYINTGILLVDAYMKEDGEPGVLGYTTSTHYCIDCRRQGGTNQKPEFWIP